MPMDSSPQPADRREARVESYLRELQEGIVAAFEAEETSLKRFHTDRWEREAGGGGVTRVLQGGTVFEKAGIGFSRVAGESLPPSASARRKDIGSRPFCAMGVSLVVHPRSPMVPTVHMNVRYFRTHSSDTGKPVWWFGGGYDLTPYYPYRNDCIHWHRMAKQVCLRHYDEEFHRKLKQWCDEYFHIRHRRCARGIGGLFFDDLNEPGFETAFAFTREVGDSFNEAYFPIVRRRKNEAYSPSQREFQLIRRGRYVEFNLVYDRGTLFGLQSDGRVESILMSLPPEVRFPYNWQPEPDSGEDALEKEYLVPQDWAAMEMEEEAGHT